MQTKLCSKCNNEFNLIQNIDGKIYRLRNRNNCLICVPFKSIDLTPKIKICEKCHKEFSQRYKDENGKSHSLQRRKFCLDCSPYKQHNTKDLNKTIWHKPHNRYYKNMTIEERKIHNKSVAKYLNKRRLDRKLKLINLLDSKCKICGYNKNFAALHFHHLDPKTKLFNLSVREIAAYSWETLLIELNKCILLCSNCHAETHHPQCEIGAPGGD